MRVAVCDDERTAREEMVTLLELYMSSRKLELEYELFEDYGALMGRIDEFDVFLMDYQMPKIDGLSFARTIRSQYGIRKAIIFVTSFDEIVYDAFAVQTHRFLVKPIQKEKFFEALDAFLETSRTVGHLIVKGDGETTSVSFDSILYIEVQRKELYICTAHEQVLCKKPISAVEAELKKADFYRVHRSYLVNMRAVRSFDREHIEFENGEKIPISQRKYADFSKAYLRLR